MMGTQLWLKDSIINFIGSLLGTNDSSDISYNKNSSNALSDSLKSVTEELSNTTNSKRKRRNNVSKINEDKLDSSLKKDLEELRNNFKYNENNKEIVIPENINVSNWSLLQNDSSINGASKEQSIASKLKYYKSKKYID